MKIVQSFSHSPSYNLALEEYLFSEFSDDFLLFYRNDKSVIIGSNQAVKNEVDLEFCKQNSIEVVRRKSGGGAVFHDLGNLNFSFIVNKSTTGDALSGSFLQPIVDLLHYMDVDVNIGQRKDLWLPNGCKVTGTASHVRKNRVLHHGTLLLETDLELLQKALNVVFFDASIKATESVRSITTNILLYLRDVKNINLNLDVFVERIIESALIKYNTPLLTHTAFDQNAISNYQIVYNQTSWTFKK